MNLPCSDIEPYNKIRDALKNGFNDIVPKFQNLLHEKWGHEGGEGGSQTLSCPNVESDLKTKVDI